MPHLFTFKNHGTFSPDGKVSVTAEEAKRINEETARKELEYWTTKPDTFCPAYYHFPADCSKPTEYRRSFYPALTGSSPGAGNTATVSTWTGSELGRIISAHVYSHNFGGRMVSIRVKGTNGASYYGRASWDTGDVIKLRRTNR